MATPKIKIIGDEGTPTKTVSKIDLGLDDSIPDDVKDQIKDEVGQFLVEQVLLSVAKAKSPVSGESFRALSPTYKKKKIKLGGAPIPNMELDGDMLNSLEAKPTEEGIEIGFFDEEAWKADGHLKFSGKENNTPKRRFLPAQGQKFNPDIMTEVSKIISDKITENSEIKKADLKDIETKRDLYDVLSEKLGIDSREEIRGAVTRNQDLFDLLQEEGLLRLL